MKPALNEALKYKNYDIIPLSEEILSDIKTPIEVLKNLKAHITRLRMNNGLGFTHGETKPSVNLMHENPRTKTSSKHMQAF